MASTHPCYVCYEPESPTNPYATNPRPCKCTGSLDIHIQCLQKIIETPQNTCKICRTKYNTFYLITKNGLELITEYNSNEISEYTVDESGKKQGKYILKNNHGRTILQYTYKDDVLNGQYIEYYEDGNIHIIASFKDDKFEGDYVEWSTNGNIIVEAFYKNGVKHGRCTRWVQKGYMREEHVTIYDNGHIIE
jgi:antitoxin component YwqK of YwqJK toxin-antitoxin module